MKLSVILRAVRDRWYITVSGLLLSFVVAGAVFSLIPAQYTSTGVAVLVQQKKFASSSASNPLLAGDGGLNTTTLTLVQALNAPVVKQQFGLTDGIDTFSVTNVDSAAVADGTDHPFLYITSQSTSAQRSADIVADVVSKARQELSTRQSAFHVAPQNQIKLESVVEATTPKAVVVKKFAISGAVLSLALIATCIAACVAHSAGLARQSQRLDGPAPAPRDYGGGQFPAIAQTTPLALRGSPDSVTRSIELGARAGGRR
jgi:hypothetical protein